MPLARGNCSPLARFVRRLTMTRTLSTDPLSTNHTIASGTSACVGVRNDARASVFDTDDTISSRVAARRPITPLGVRVSA